MATEDYPATPGDVYALVYLKVAQLDTINLVVEGDGSINAGFLGTFASRGLTFRQLKAQIEKKVAASYPGSNPSLIIASTGLFPVTVKGEVKQAGIATAWGLSRLSEVVAPFLGEYSSLREVSVRSRDGVTATYDLFKARRSGDLSRDPYLKPGDIVEIKRADRTVAIEGQVRRAGAYQLLAGEGLLELVAFYGDGALDGAKTDRALLTRKATAEKPEAESLVVDLGGKTFPALADGDVLRVPSREEYLPIVSIEGAVAGAELGVKREALQGGAEAVETQQYRVIRLPYRQGSMLSEALRSIRGQIDPRADLKRAFIAKAGGSGQVEVDLERLLYRFDPKDDIALAADDKVVIPYGSQYVFVTGEVAKSAWVGVTGLTRLSEAVKPLATRFSSLRDVVVKSADGAVARYDLFLAERQGDLTQDPYLRPGDQVEVGKADRIVTLEGEVRRPGSYQLLAGEGVAELLARYGDGAVEGAKTDLAVLTRKATAALPEGESLVFDLAGSPLPALGDGDRVRVPSREEYLPVVYVQGAVAGAELGVKKDAQAGNAGAVVAEQYRVLRLAYRQGQLLSQALRGIRDQIDPRADLKRAFIVRKGQAAQVAVDLEKLLYRYTPADDVTLAADDTIVIPYGSMYAFVSGEVGKSAWVGITGLTRLSEAVKPLLTKYSSLRDVAVRSEDGSSVVYDLFKAEREGDLSQDPYLRPGDVVEVKKAGRIVSLEGEVGRPGAYQLLPGEGVAELVGYYGAKALPSAKGDLSVLTRRATAERPESESLVFDLAGKDLPALVDGDRVRVPSREEYLPVIYVEGAVAGAELGVKKEAQAGNAAAVVTEQYRVLRLAFRQGQLLSQALLGVKDQIDPRADLKRAFVSRKGQDKPIEVDLEKLLYRYDAADDLALKAEDRVVLPYGAMFVFATGEVTKSTWVGITGLTRLAEVAKPLATPYASLREVAVESEDGAKAVYALFLAERKGDLSQDPYLRPGDIVTLKKADRAVTLEGEVRRPGRYQLLPNEGVDQLVSQYGDGALESAKLDRVALTRRATGDNPDSETLVFALGGQALPALADGDRVRIPSREEYLPVVYVEGAVQKAEAAAAAGTVNAAPAEPKYGEKRVMWRKGLLVSQTMAILMAGIPDQADYRSAMVVRAADKSVVKIDLDRLLFAHDASLDFALEADDRVVLPFKAQAVFITGEVAKSGFAPVSGAQRLSEALKPFLLPSSSTRNVVVTSAEGVSAAYDLFRAERFGESAQDPLLRPGDGIAVAKAARVVSLAGEVNRPGTYELLPGEGLAELLSIQGAGLREFAKRDRILVTRRASDGKPSGESLVVDAGAGAAQAAAAPALLDGDAITVPSREEFLPVVYVEGAMAAGGYGIQRVLWREGLLVSQALKPIAASLPAAADLRRARLLRAKDGSEARLDLEKLLFAFDPALDAVLGAGDRIILPYGSRDVFVSGEVARSGWVQADGTLRLSQAIKAFLLPTSSTRAVALRSADGKEAVYDLFKAERFGDIAQDPVLAPGDAITLRRVGRVVVLEGEVFRPGTYELLPTEDFNALISVQGAGLRDTAQAGRVQITRKASDTKTAGGIALVDALAKDSQAVLFDGDKVRVPSMDEYLPVVYIEGAVAGEYSVQRVAWRDGMRVADLIRPLRDRIPATADLKKAFITKSSADAPVSIDLEKILYSYDPAYDLPLEPEDRLVIPLGSMYVFVTGEVQKSVWTPITGLTRLRDVVSANLTRWSSTRDVAVASRNGVEQHYDLFRAERYGDLTQDPFLRPGDVVTVNRLERLVTIGGEVRRPGTYQLLSGEGMKDLVERYADGFTEKANPTRIQVVRLLSTASAVGEKLQFDYKAAPDFSLNQYDSITVPAWQDLLPVAWFEGAVGVGTAGATLEAAKRVPYTFFPGETVAEAAQTMRKNFSEVSDLAAAYISRKGERVAVDLTKYLYDRTSADGPILEANDVIVVPFRQFFVTVSGAVRLAGRYPYVPDRTWEYYVGLAGGFDSDKNAGDKVTIYDVSSKKVSSTGRVIMPEDNIIAASNSVMYNLLKVASVLSTAISLIALVISLLP
ncbi:SLBB domain-containing protein [bacterium]|nr:SLBB domain-containing protein [bacterium]